MTCADIAKTIAETKPRSPEADSIREHFLRWYAGLSPFARCCDEPVRKLAEKELARFKAANAVAPIMGALERRNPLPVGFYWQDAFGDDVKKIQAWTKAHRDTVHVKESSTYSNPEGLFVKFEVTSETPWDGPGYPTIAGKSTTHEDTSTLKESIEHTRANPLTAALDPYGDTAAVKKTAKDLGDAAKHALPSPWTIAAVVGGALAIALMVLKRVP